MGAPKMESDESNRATGATLGMCFPTFFLSSFLSLMEEKRAKENQAPTGGGEVGRVQDRAGVVFSEVCREREGAGVVFSDGGGRVTWVREMFLDRGYGAVGAALGRSFPTFFLSSFLSLVTSSNLCLHDYTGERDPVHLFLCTLQI